MNCLSNSLLRCLTVYSLINYPLHIMTPCALVSPPLSDLCQLIIPLKFVHVCGRRLSSTYTLWLDNYANYHSPTIQLSINLRKFTLHWCYLALLTLGNIPSQIIVHGYYGILVCPWCYTTGEDLIAFDSVSATIDAHGVLGVDATVHGFVRGAIWTLKLKLGFVFRLV